MKAVSGKEMASILRQRGWVLDRIRGSHHIFKRTGHPATIPVPIHGNKTLPIGTQLNIMRAAGLTDADLE
jgi:predicted RNA binding protein YcfA (HicA-like mRNA interferase family)